MTEARTERLRRVAQLTEQGGSASEIAVRLGVSVRQIVRDRADIKECGVPSPVVRPPTAKDTPCQDDPDLWFPNLHGGQHSGAFYRLPKRLCQPCPLLLPCLQHALDFPEIHGVWGGTSPADRDRIHRETPCDPCAAAEIAYQATRPPRDRRATQPTEGAA